MNPDDTDRMPEGYVETLMQALASLPEAPPEPEDLDEAEPLL